MLFQFTTETLDIESSASKFQLPGVGGTIGELIGSLLGIVMVIALLILLLYLTLGALEWMSSAGDNSKLQSARNRMLHAVIGIMILASVVAVFSFTQYVLGVDFIKFKSSSSNTGTCTPTNTKTCPTGSQ